MPVHLLVAYIVANHAFVNNNKLGEMEEKRNLYQILWGALVILAFSFDTLFTTPKGIFVFTIAIVLLPVILFLRTRLSQDLVEFLAIILYAFLSFLVSDLLHASFITTPFAWYLLGILLVTVGVTYFFRKGIIDSMKSDSIGITERLVIYIFAFAGKIEWVIISVLVAIVYRVIFSKERKIEWVLSPVFGVGFSFVWKLIMENIF
ncbi:MAG: hypothetical protein R6U52_07955 [Kosmotogaceae bacterium]